MQGISWLRKAGEGLLSLFYPGGSRRKRRPSKKDWKKAAKWIDEREATTKKGLR